MSRTINGTDLNDYLYYAEVVEHGGFAAASRVLRIPKSRLSRRISELETRLGVCLIERSTRFFRVTDVGRSFYRQCRVILEVAQEAEAIAAGSRSDPKGDVRFSCPTALVEIVAPTLPQFLSQYPGVQLQMLAVDRAVDPLHEGIDLALRVRTKLDSTTTLKMRSLGISRKILVSDFHLATAVGGDFGKLGSMPTLSTSEEPGEAEWTLVGPGGQTRRMRHAPRMRCGDFAAIRDAAAEGAGVAYLPDHLCREQLACGRLVQVLPEWHSPDGFVHVVFTARKGLPAAVRAFLNHLVEAFPPGILSDREPGRLRLIKSQGGARNARIVVEAS